VGKVKKAQLLGLIRCSDVILHEPEDFGKKEKVVQGDLSEDHEAKSLLKHLRLLREERWMILQKVGLLQSQTRRC
jgi:hypothetical protein